MPHPFLIFSPSDYLIQILDTNSHISWQTVQIQISWLLQKPIDLDLHCLQRQGISGFSRTRVKFAEHCGTDSAVYPVEWNIFVYLPKYMDNKCLNKQCRARSNCYVVWIYTVFHLSATDKIHTSLFIHCRWDSKQKNVPAGTQRRNDVVSTAHRR